MTDKQKVTIKILIALTLTLLYSLAVGFFYQNFEKVFHIIMFVTIPLTAFLFAVSIGFKKGKLFKLLVIVAGVGALAIVGAGMIIKSHILDAVSDVEELKALIVGYGTAGKLIFILLEFLQVTFVPIPSTVVTAAGATLYSMWEALLLSCIGLWLGSLLAFFLGRTFGVKLVKWVIGDEMLIKYNNFVKGKDKAMLVYMFIFPIFPDDVLCMIAGLTTMSYPGFILVQLISRPLNVFGTVFLINNMSLIPFEGWGIAVWVLVGVVFIVTFILMWKYADKIEKAMLKIISKITGKPIMRDINAIYRIKNPLPAPAPEIQPKSIEEVYKETNNKLTDIISSKNAKQLAVLKETDEICNKLLTKKDKRIKF